MDEFAVYKMYIALKLHFTTDNYDVIKRNGKIKASRQAFAKRKDFFQTGIRAQKKFWSKW